MFNFHLRYIKSSIKTFAIKHLLRGRFDGRSTLLLTSSPRSGSTWLGNILRSIRKSCILFEPLQIDHVPEAKDAGLSWRTYVPYNSKWEEGELFFNRIFCGDLINRWTAGEMSLKDAYLANTMIIKFVRANRLLPWLCENFAIHTPILLLRHPCAVIASQLKSKIWQTYKKPDIPSYISNFPSIINAVNMASSIEEHLAILWALDQIPPLVYKKKSINIVTYEQLYLYPEKTISDIFAKYNFKFDKDRALSFHKKPSNVVYKSGISGISGWKSQLSHNQICNILQTIRLFGIKFYDHRIEPNYDILENKFVFDNSYEYMISE